MAPARRRTSQLRLAELLSGIGAAVVGLGLGALLPDRLRALGTATLLIGVTVHLIGMTAKHRLQAGETRVGWVMGAYWLCFALLAGLLAWALAQQV